MDENTNKDSDDLRMLKNKRKALKGSITKRIAELQRLVIERGSRTKIRFLQDKMNGVLIQMHEVADKVLKITKDYVVEEWMQQETVRADEIAAEIADYLASREGDAPSDENATTASWVEAHSDTRYEPSEISATNSQIELLGATAGEYTSTATHVGTTSDHVHNSFIPNHDTFQNQYDPLQNNLYPTSEPFIPLTNTTSQNYESDPLMSAMYTSMYSTFGNTSIYQVHAPEQTRYRKIHYPLPIQRPIFICPLYHYKIFALPICKIFITPIVFHECQFHRVYLLFLPMCVPRLIRIRLTHGSTS